MLPRFVWLDFQRNPHPKPYKPKMLPVCSQDSDQGASFPSIAVNRSRAWADARREALHSANHAGKLRTDLQHTKLLRKHNVKIKQHNLTETSSI